MAKTEHFEWETPDLGDEANVPADLSSVADQIEATLHNLDVAELGTAGGGDAGKLIIVNETGEAVWRALGGDATLAQTGSITIGSEKVDTGKLKDLAVTAAKLAAESVESAKVKALAITAAKLAAAAVETSKIKDLAVTEGKLADEAVTAPKLHMTTKSMESSAELPLRDEFVPGVQGELKEIPKGKYLFVARLIAVQGGSAAEPYMEVAATGGVVNDGKVASTGIKDTGTAHALTGFVDITSTTGTVILRTYSDPGSSDSMVVFYRSISLMGVGA